MSAFGIRRVGGGLSVNRGETWTESTTVGITGVSFRDLEVRKT